MKNNAFSRFIACVLTICLLGAATPLPAWAGIVGTDAVAATAGAEAERTRVKSFLARDEVRSQMIAQGVDPRAVRDRVDALTDEEVSQLAGRIDQLPAGGDSIWGVLLAVFVILLITDILGYTNVFPFTRR